MQMKNSELYRLYNDFDFSYGAITYDKKISTDELLRKADLLMYQDKNRKNKRI